MTTKALICISRAVASFILLVFGYYVTFWGGISLLGGPDGRILSRESFIYGGGLLIVAVAAIEFGRRLVGARVLVHAPLVVCLVSWVAAITISKPVVFYAFFAGVLTSALGCVVYWFIALVGSLKNLGR